MRCSVRQSVHERDEIFTSVMIGTYQVCMAPDPRKLLRLLAMTWVRSMEVLTEVVVSQGEGELGRG